MSFEEFVVVASQISTGGDGCSQGADESSEDCKCAGDHAVSRPADISGGVVKSGFGSEEEGEGNDARCEEPGQESGQQILDHYGEPDESVGGADELHGVDGESSRVDGQMDGIVDQYERDDEHDEGEDAEHYGDGRDIVVHGADHSGVRGGHLFYARDCGEAFGGDGDRVGVGVRGVEAYGDFRAQRVDTEELLEVFAGVGFPLREGLLFGDEGGGAGGGESLDLRREAARALETLSARIMVSSTFSRSRRVSRWAAKVVMAIMPMMSSTRVTLTIVVACAAQKDILTSF